MNHAALHYLFSPEPTHWGLRGDPHLWQELRQMRATLPLPGTPTAAAQLLHTLYHQLVGEAPAPGRYVFVARYVTGGMSSGRVDATFWLERGFPLLLHRMAALQATQPPPPVS